MPNPVGDGLALYSYWLFEEAETTIEVFDAKGRKVEVLVDKEILPKGAHQELLDWSIFAAGVYYIRLLSADLNLIIPVVKL